MRFNMNIHRPTKVYIYQIQTLIQSIYDHYDYDEVEVMVYYFDLAEDEINLIKSKHPVGFKNLGFLKSVKNLAAYKLNFWYEMLKDCDTNHQVFMDCDMLLYRRIDHFFTGDFDIAYTYKTEKDETLRKPLNTGLVLVDASRHMVGVRNFFKWWKDATNDRINKIPVYKGAWGAHDQHTLGEFLGTSATNEYAKLVRKDGLVFKGIPCKFLNEIVCRELEGNLDTHVIHYKGRWRWVLPNGTWKDSKKDKNRCQYMYNLWKETFDRFNNL